MALIKEPNERCDRCNKLLDAHARVTVERKYRAYLCPTRKGTSPTECLGVKKTSPVYVGDNLK